MSQAGLCNPIRATVGVLLYKVYKGEKSGVLHVEPSEPHHSTVVTRDTRTHQLQLLYISLWLMSRLHPLPAAGHV
jgi:hypothetical protein